MASDVEPGRAPQPAPYPSFSATSLSLLDRARNRDEAAWQRLATLYGPLVGSWCRRSGLSLEDSHDLVQDVFASVAAHLEDFRLEPGGTFRGWLRVITRNKIRDHFRKRADDPHAEGGSTARMRLEQVPEPDCDDPEVDAKETAGVYSRALDLVRGDFEQKTWQAFWQGVVENRTTGEVAASLGMSPGAVRQAKYKVLRRLRVELGDVMEWPNERATAEPEV